MTHAHAVFMPILYTFAPYLFPLVHTTVIHTHRPVAPIEHTDICRHTPRYPLARIITYWTPPFYATDYKIFPNPNLCEHLMWKFEALMIIWTEFVESNESPTHMLMNCEIYPFPQNIPILNDVEFWNCELKPLSWTTPPPFCRELVKYPNPQNWVNIEWLNHDVDKYLNPKTPELNEYAVLALWWKITGDDELWRR